MIFAGSSASRSGRTPGSAKRSSARRSAPDLHSALIHPSPASKVWTDQYGGGRRVYTIVTRWQAAVATWLLTGAHTYPLVISDRRGSASALPRRLVRGRSASPAHARVAVV